jgi:hypothetical protein
MGFRGLFAIRGRQNGFRQFLPVLDADSRSRHGGRPEPSRRLHG